ncbi:MAG: D-alanyl-D-alanine carboxypeptidase/D-alanyl-D-alanine endopeptidase [Candidatus Nanopelagicales bacterium]|jgi:D-alanyl-D-alanine carboxypeptidase/D-alanyl-D-alanine-endopeptidase (penicillin-binding protein 4)
MPLIVGLGVVAFAGSLVAAPATAAPADDSIERSALAAMRAPALGGDATLHVRHIASDATVADDGAQERQIPASTMKVMTAATSLSTLGENFRFTTRVVAGATSGRIVLVGGGDPLLSTRDLRMLAKRTARSLGGGTVVVDVDDYLFPRPSDAEGWEPGDRPTYASAVRPLGLLGSYSNDTVAIAWSAFVQALRAKGVSASVGDRVLASDEAARIAFVRPHTLREAVRVMLTVSENNVAEVLYRQVALGRGYPATWSGSSSAAKEALRGLGLQTWRMKLIDGSGLSGSNRLTAASLTEVLDVAMSEPSLDALIDGLPVAGRSGTLINRFAAPPASCARGEVAAKTGSLTGVSTLAGVTKGSDGQWRSFAIMVNKRPWSYPSASTSLAIDTVAAIVQGCA